ncbi:hypothetical protein [Marichromatium bheemlicum]|uniref:Uncharacterized protein n=1 Tax=Marichromatium bheemlicum TaxID=365339 RepID=A0ABX1I6U9_9GAMM|nr:hypothetical protein [Marichromatium bheemlicum]NKN32471.1 hypothetical protein [Marichromatium bheemlicum]
MPITRRNLLRLLASTPALAAVSAPAPAPPRPTAPVILLLDGGRLDTALASAVTTQTPAAVTPWPLHGLDAPALAALDHRLAHAITPTRLIGWLDDANALLVGECVRDHAGHLLLEQRLQPPPTRAATHLARILLHPPEASTPPHHSARLALSAWIQPAASRES